MARLLGLIADNLRPGNAVMDHILDWEGDTSSRGHSVPLRLAGGLHALVLDGRDPQLAEAYPPATVSDAQLWAAVNGALASHSARLIDWMATPPQTNEVRRAAALIPTGTLLSDMFGLPLTLTEIGASGGLNLNFERFAVQARAMTLGPTDPALTLTPVWEGEAPVQAAVQVAGRRGVDLNPLTRPQDALALRAYLWPDQPERRALTDAALALPRAQVDRGDVADWLPARLAEPTDGTTHLIYHTIAWQYLPPATQEKCTALIEAAGAAATEHAPLAWMGLEADDHADGAALSLRLWPGNRQITLGRADFHGRWVRWTPKELE